jgi:hypothetical protein
MRIVSSYLKENVPRPHHKVNELHVFIARASLILVRTHCTSYIYISCHQYIDTPRPKSGLHSRRNEYASNNRVTSFPIQRRCKHAFSTIEILCFMRGQCKVVIKKS